jgi:hypothetical protein
MAEIQNWQKQSMSKNGGATGPSTMHSKITGNSNALHGKIAKPTAYANGGIVRKYADGSVGGVDSDNNGSFRGYDQGEFAGVDAAVAKREADSGEWARGENYGDGTTGQERVDAAKAPESVREASNDEVRAAMKDGEAKPARQAPRQASKSASSSVSRSMPSASDESDAETNRLRSANANAASSKTQARSIQPAKSAGTYRGFDGKVHQKSPETASEPVDIGGAISRGASAVGNYFSSLTKSPERKPVSYRGLDGKMHKSGE